MTRAEDALKFIQIYLSPSLYLIKLIKISNEKYSIRSRCSIMPFDRLNEKKKDPRRERESVGWVEERFWEKVDDKQKVGATKTHQCQ